MSSLLSAEKAKRPRLKFGMLSLLGAFIYLCPVPTEQSFTIPFGMALDWFNAPDWPIVSLILVTVTIISAVLTTVMSIAKLGPREGFIAETFRVSPLWVILRVLGATFCILYFTGAGPEMVTAQATGGTVIGFLVQNLLALFLLASLTLPLLTNYGLMEFVGVFTSGIFKRLFHLPGRAAIGGMASWLGSAPVGAMMTVQQYNNGFFTQREAVTVATTFAVASVPFCYVIAQIVGLESVFLSFYASIVFIGVVCAIILPRIPPLSCFSNTYKPGTNESPTGLIRPDESMFQAGVRLGVARAETSGGMSDFAKASIRNLIDTWFGLIPATLAIAMISVMVAEYTPVFNWLSFPFASLLEWLNVADAQKAAPGMIVGFADMYLPSLLGTHIESQETRFLIGVLSVSQLIYMSEVGALLLRSNLGIKLWHLIILFLIRTLISIPIAILLARYVVF
ncbi:YjiH family protein [Carnimonas nigrificans]|uniref:YjiH family protein n=1 Tax=Carnimonas nigrificans TaxID=64323 RepID=UPI000470F828|nr:YjiH family protein [Carnimonas nigrificans]